MSVRKCVYKGCENYSINSVPNGTFTLFQFPKDPTRRLKWMELGQVNPHIPPHCLYMCSDHFDHSKHMSINQRRNVLLGTAIPYSYVCKNNSVETPTSIISSKVETITCTDQDNAPYVFFDEVEVADAEDDNNEVTEEQYPVESTIEDGDLVNILTYKEIGIASEDNVSDDQEAENSYASVALNTSYKRDDKTQSEAIQNKKRRFTETQVVSASKDSFKKISLPWKEVATKTKNKQTSKSKYNAATKKISEPDGNNTSQVEVDESALIDTQHVTTFIFKGEEYVQMSREYYLKDKLAMMQKLNKYENVLKCIKQKLSLLDIN